VFARLFYPTPTAVTSATPPRSRHDEAPEWMKKTANGHEAGSSFGHRRRQDAAPRRNPARACFLHPRSRNSLPVHRRRRHRLLLRTNRAATSGTCGVGGAAAVDAGRPLSPSRRLPTAWVASEQEEAPCSASADRPARTALGDTPMNRAAAAGAATRACVLARRLLVHLSFLGARGVTNDLW
jgi:hypothetical protein